MGALENGHEHRVHHTEHTDKDGEERRAPTHGLDEPKSFIVTEVFAHGHSPNFRDQLLDLSSKFLDLLLGARRRHANIDCVDLVGRADDSLQERQRKNDRAVFDERATLHDSDDR